MMWGDMEMDRTKQGAEAQEDTGIILEGQDSREHPKTGGKDADAFDMKRRKGGMRGTEEYN